MVEAIAGGGDKQKQLHVANNNEKHCNISQRNLVYSVWKASEKAGTLAACTNMVKFTMIVFTNGETRQIVRSQLTLNEEVALQ